MSSTTAAAPSAINTQPQQPQTQVPNTSQPPSPRRTRPQSLMFINSTEYRSKNDSQTRRRIKSHVMKGVLDKKNARELGKVVSNSSTASHSSTASYDGGRAARTASVDSSSSYSPGGSYTSPSTATTTTYPSPELAHERTPNAHAHVHANVHAHAHANPYAKAAFAMKPEHAPLLDFYVAYLCRSVAPFEARVKFHPIRQGWLPMVLSDEVLYFACLYHAAVRMQIEHPGTAIPLGIESTVIEKLNRRLNEEVVPSPTTIGAVAVIAEVETMLGQEDRWQAHAQGLNKMIEMNGGLSNLDEALQIMIKIADLEKTSSALCRPYLPVMEHTRPPIYLSIPFASRRADSRPFWNMLVNSGMSMRLLATMSDFTRFNNALAVILADGYTYHPYAFCQDLIQIYSEIMDLTLEDQNPLARAVQLASLIYLKSLLLRNNIANPKMKTIPLELKRTLTALPVDEVPKPLLLWLLMVGGIGAGGPPDDGWYLRSLLSLLKSMNTPCSWDDAKRCLERMLWLPELHDAAGREFFERAVAIETGYRRPMAPPI